MIKNRLFFTSSITRFHKQIVKATDLKKTPNILLSLMLLVAIATSVSCSGDEPVPPTNDDPEEEPETTEFIFGADLSYVNQILDQGGVYLDSGVVESPYKTFAQHGTGLARFRLWHNPTWTKELYGDDGIQLYNDLYDVEKGIQLARSEGMKILLDFHYSDDWADPGNQEIPAAWEDITSIQVLGDSVYNYTLKTLIYLEGRGLLPEYVQIGNETNCGMFISNVPDGFPDCNVCEGGVANFRSVVKRGISAIREVSSTSSINTKIILHVADPSNVNWWFNDVMNNGELTGFDIIGFSYYPIWHNTISLAGLKQNVINFKSTFNKDIMIMETAYPWTNDGADNYNNLFGGNTEIGGYPFSPEGQVAMMTKIAESMIEAGALGMVYWEPAWISSPMVTQWGTGSSWENSAFYDFDGNANSGFDFMTHDYSED